MKYRWVFRNSKSTILGLTVAMLFCGTPALAPGISLLVFYMITLPEIQWWQKWDFSQDWERQYKLLKTRNQNAFSSSWWSTTSLKDEDYALGLIYSAQCGTSPEGLRQQVRYCRLQWKYFSNFRPTIYFNLPEIITMVAVVGFHQWHLFCYLSKPIQHLSDWVRQ